MMKKLTSEFLGPFCLVFVGPGTSIVNDVSSGVVSHVGVTITFNLISLAMIYALGDMIPSLSKTNSKSNYWYLLYGLFHYERNYTQHKEEAG
jgi:glycerol uptake facilitator-like aquaporin